MSGLRSSNKKIQKLPQKKSITGLVSDNNKENLIYGNNKKSGHTFDSHNHDIKELQEKPIEYLVLSGGGAKGIGYSGVYEALEETGAMYAVKAIAGSSAGALSAAFIATGMDPTAFQELMQATNLRDLLGKEGIWLLGKDGTPLYELLDKTIKNNVSTFLNETDIEGLIETRLDTLEVEQKKTQTELNNVIETQKNIGEHIQQLTHTISEQNDQQDIIAVQKQIAIFQQESHNLDEKKEHLSYTNAELQNSRVKINAIKQGSDKSLELLKQKSKNNEKILFKDLGLLHLLAPNKFKDLYVTAVNRDTGELKLFNAEDTPDVEIALACRASASIPIVFQPVTIDGVKYVDGGYRDNTPYNHFKGPEIKSKIEDISNDPKKIKEARTKGRTLAFVFADDNSKMALYSSKENYYKPSLVKQFLANICFKILSKVGGKFQYTQTLAETYERMREQTLQTIPLATKGVTTLSFKDAQKKRKHLHVSGYLQTMNYLNNHELNQASTTHLPLQEFFLEVYDKVDQHKFHGTWEKKVNTSLQEKKEQLLDFCMPAKWKDVGGADGKPINHDDLVEHRIKQYIFLAATSRTTKLPTPNTATIDCLLSVLNKKSTNLRVIEKFAQVLGKTKIEGKPLVFTKKDIETFLAREKDHYKPAPKPPERDR